VEFDLGLRSVYEHLSASAGRTNDVSIAQLLLAILAGLAVLFLIILAVAFLVGFVLAQSITGAVHELFEGTEKVAAATSRTRSSCTRAISSARSPSRSTR
jgi:hypothetical protein